MQYKQKNKHTVCIIGCGSIGALKDSVYDSPTTDAILTHAHAFYSHPETELVAFVDTDKNNADMSSSKWSKKDFSITSIRYEDWKARKAYTDIIVIATPTHTHRDVLMEALEHQPKVVVAEKPFCRSVKEAREVHDAYTKANIPIIVDYIRRYDNIADDIFADLRDGSYGEIYHARCLYGRGLRRDGCHAIDIFGMVLGEVRGLSYDHRGILDGVPFDPTLTIRLEYEKCREVYLVGTDSRAWGAFEMDFVTEKGIVRFTDWGKVVQYFKPETETTYGQYAALSASAEKVTTNLTKALLYLADDAVQACMFPDHQPKCTSLDAIRVHEVLEQIKT